MSNNVQADAYYENGYGYQASKCKKVLSRANSPSAGYAHAMCWRKPLVNKLEKELIPIKNDAKQVAEKNRLLAKKKTEEDVKKNLDLQLKELEKALPPMEQQK